MTNRLLATLRSALAGSTLLSLLACAQPVEPPAPVPAPPIEAANMQGQLFAQYGRLQQMACLSSATYNLRQVFPGQYAYDPAHDPYATTCRNWLQNPSARLIGFPITLKDNWGRPYDSFYIVWTDVNRHEQVIAARGTDDLQDWEANIRFEPVADDILMVNVHEGFHRYARQIYDSLTKDHPNLVNPSYDLYLTGHSLGGAAAVLTGLYFYVQTPYKYKIKGVYTFGQPRVFDNRGATSWPDFAQNVYHVENCYDPVPLVPIGDDVLHFFYANPLATNSARRQYQHMGHEILLLDPGKYWISDEIIRNLLSDLQVIFQDVDQGHLNNHSIEMYIGRIWALRGNDGHGFPQAVNPAYHFGQNCYPYLRQS